MLPLASSRSSSPHAHSFVIGPAVIKHTQTHTAEASTFFFLDYFSVVILLERSHGRRLSCGERSTSAKLVNLLVPPARGNGLFGSGNRRPGVLTAHIGVVERIGWLLDTNGAVHCVLRSVSLVGWKILGSPLSFIEGETQNRSGGNVCFSLRNVVKRLRRLKPLFFLLREFASRISPLNLNYYYYYIYHYLLLFIQESKESKESKETDR